MNSRPVTDFRHPRHGATDLDHLVHLRHIDIENRTSALRRAAGDERLVRSAAQLRHAERVHGASVPHPGALRVRLARALVAAGHALARDAAERPAS